MKLSDFDLKQIDDHRVEGLSFEQLVPLTKSLLNDLKEARDRLNQNSNNSSRPPSSMPPWNHSKNSGDLNEEIVDEYNDEEEEDLEELDQESDESADEVTSQDGKQASQEKPNPLKRTAGKQPGSPGYGRTQELGITETIEYRLEHCSLCATSLEESSQQAWTAWCTIDIAPPYSDQPGMTLTNTKHTLYECTCSSCGHYNHVEPTKALPDALWPKTDISQWRLVGPRLAAMIVLLSKRYRQSRARISEFLKEFFKLELSVGTIHQTIQEAGRSAAPLEAELITEIEKAVLVYADETSWKIAAALAWLWVFKTATVVLFAVGKRDATIISKLLFNSLFKGKIMSDGWVVYRQYMDRLRCWAHLIRKALGLSESCNAQVAQIGCRMFTLLQSLQLAILAARDGSDEVKATLPERCRNQMNELQILCQTHQENKHGKVSAFSKELLYDWEVIMRPVFDPTLPLTNNEAERTLRHWVIDRRLSHGTRTEEGTRSFTILASVIETCRLRKASTWDFLTQVVEAARHGLQIPSLPPMLQSSAP